MSTDAAAESPGAQGQPHSRNQDSADPGIGSMPHQAGTAEPSGGAPASGVPAGPAGVMTAFSPFPQTLGFLLDVRISVSVEVGRVQMPVRQVMELGPGAVIELQRSASEPVEIHANGKCIGRGEIVVVGEQFGVRVTELGPPA